MVTVQDFMDTNDDVLVRLQAKESRDEYDPLVNPFWQGLLTAIPEEYRSLEVLSEGWLMGAEINALNVYAPDKMFARFPGL